MTNKSLSTFGEFPIAALSPTSGPGCNARTARTTDFVSCEVASQGINAWIASDALAYRSTFGGNASLLSRSTVSFEFSNSLIGVLKSNAFAVAFSAGLLSVETILEPVGDQRLARPPLESAHSWAIDFPARAEAFVGVIRLRAATVKAPFVGVETTFQSAELNELQEIFGF